MIQNCKLAAAQISDIDALNANTAANALSEIENLNVSRLLITDQNGKAIFDSDSVTTIASQYALYPEITQALRGNDVFYWNFNDGIMRSSAATPVYSYGTLIGCVYMIEYDHSQGTLFATLQKNILMLTLILEVIVILYSLFFSNIYSRRLKKILTSIRTVRKGDYTHRVTLRGHDELTELGNEFDDLTYRLRVSEEKRSRFVSDASHELKTPLASIKLLSDSILQNEMDIETIREFVIDIGNEADRLNRLTQKLLTLSRADAQPDHIYNTSKISPTIYQVIRMLQNNAAENNIKIIQNISTDCSILIIEDDLYQILFNLIENGIKYNKSGGTLTISLHTHNQEAIIQVTDTGVGIPASSMEHIFERFYRVDKARSRTTGGSGLGLSIVRNLVERNNGKIFVKSEIGKGTMFTVSFPVHATAEDI